MVTHIQRKTAQWPSGFGFREALCGVDNTQNSGPIMPRKEIYKGWRVCKRCLKIYEGRTER